MSCEKSLSDEMRSRPIRHWPLRAEPLKKAVRLATHMGAGLLVVGIPLTQAGSPDPLFPAALELSSLDGTNGFALPGVADDFTGWSASGVGDINGDGMADLTIGAIGGHRAYVIFGGSDLGANGTFELASIDGTNGFRVEAYSMGDIGGGLSGGADVNGDGWSDLLLGAPTAQPTDILSQGAAYVLFGGPGVGAGGTIALADVLDGTRGFELRGFHEHGFAGRSVDLIGDFNGDGFSDLIVGADGASPAGRTSAGQSYIVFGGPTVGASGVLNFVALNGSNGFAVNGINFNDFSGVTAHAAGDVNGDGFADVVIGAMAADPGGRLDAGVAYVVFGGPGPFDARIELAGLDGSNGFAMHGIDPHDACGRSVSGAGDMNGDGFDEVIVGAHLADAPGAYTTGESYVVFGGPVVGNEGRLELADLNGGNGFLLPGSDENDRSGSLVAGAGDVNGDGFDDVLIGAYKGDPGGRIDAGEAYVVFGAPEVGSGGVIVLSTLDGSNGFSLNGVIAGDGLSRTLSHGRPAGDINGDGIDDIVLGAVYADRNGEQNTGEGYLVYGRSAADADGDGVADAMDNCTLRANPDQRDSNGDGFGNLCDPDLDDDGVVNFGDLGALKAVFFTADPDADFDGDGAVAFADLGVMKSFFFLPPGPSGQAD